MSSTWQNHKTFAERFDAFINSRGYTHRQLSKLLNIGEATLSRLRNGRRVPDLDDILAMEKVWGRDITFQLLFDAHNSGNGITWIEPWPIFYPRTTVEESQSSIKAFRDLMQQNSKNTDLTQHKPSRQNQRKQLSQLKFCLLNHLVQITDVRRNKALESDLKKAYHLDECIVADIDLPSNPVIDSVIRAEAIAFLAARDVSPLLFDENEHIGISGGTPIYRFVDLLPASLEKLKGITWWSLLSTNPLMIGGAPAGTGANDTISRVAHSQSNVTCHRLPFAHPEQLKRKSEGYLSVDEARNIEGVERCLHNAKNVTVAVISVGNSDFNFGRLDPALRKPVLSDIFNHLPSNEQSRCVGDILLRLVDIDGRMLGDENEYRKFVYSVELSDLRRIVNADGHVWILAEREDKAGVVYAAITSGVANALVIDKSIADKLNSPEFLDRKHRNDNSS